MTDAAPPQATAVEELALHPSLHVVDSEPLLDDLPQLVAAEEPGEGPEVVLEQAVRLILDR